MVGVRWLKVRVLSGEGARGNFPVNTRIEKQTMRYIARAYTQHHHAFAALPLDLSTKYEGK